MSQIRESANLLSVWYEDAFVLSSPLNQFSKFERTKVDFIRDTLRSFLGNQFFEVNARFRRTVPYLHLDCYQTYRRRAELFMNTIEDKDSLYKVMRSKTDLSHLSKVAEAIEANPRLFENIEQAKEIYSLLKQYNVNDLEQLRELLDSKGSIAPERMLLPVTQEILANMGITSLKEWQEAIKDKDLAALFSHQSTPTTDMFVICSELDSEGKSENCRA